MTGDLRVKIWERDRGVCVRCKTDTEALRAAYLDLQHDPAAARRFLEEHGIPRRRADGPWWEIVGRQTYCLACHWAMRADKNDRGRGLLQEML